MREQKKWALILLITALIFTCIPAQAARAAVTGADLSQLFSKIDSRNNGNWYKDYNNENGVLAWDESYVMHAYLEMYQATKDVKYLDKFIVHADSVLKQRDSERGVKDYRGLSLPAWRAGDRYTQNGTFQIFEVHTAMIAYPYALFAALVKENPALAGYQGKANIYLKAAKDAMAVHDGIWTETATEMYTNRPFNMFLSLGSVYLEIYRASGDESYLTKATKIATHFKNNLTLDSGINGYRWYYTRSGSYGFEDLSHGAMDIQFAYLAYKNNAVFTQTDMQRFGNTIQKKLIKTDGTVANRVDGSGTSGNQSFIGLWMMYYPWSSSLFNTSYQKVAAVAAPQGEDLLSAALLNKAYAEMNGGEEPSPYPVTPPQIKITNSVDGKYVKQQIRLAADVADDGSVAQVVFSYGTGAGGPWTSIGSGGLSAGTAQSGTWILDWDVQNLADGPYWVRVKAVDDKGAESQADCGRVVKDTVGPQVVSTVPGDNALVQTVSSVSATFSEPVTNINSATFSLEGVTGQAQYDAASKTAIFTPAAALKAGASYRAVLTSGITDLAGNPLTATSWAFQVPANQSAEEYIKNGGFTGGKTGWSGTDVSIKSESNGNQYGTAGYGWAFYQDLSLVPGEYRLNARTLKGTSSTEARIVVMFIDAAGKRTVSYAKLYKHRGTGWESMPEQVIAVPKSAVITRIYLLTNGGSGYHGFDDISLKASKPAAVPSLMVNGDSTAGKTGWSGTDVTVKSESNGNKYGSAVYGWAFYQDLKLAPGQYLLNARTKKGTASTEARMVVMFIDGAGNRTVGYAALYRHKGTGWESMPEQTIAVPKSAVTTRIYLLTNGGSGYHDFDDIRLTQI